MGVGIAHVFAALGEPIVVVEADDARAGAAHRAIAESLMRAGARGHVADADAALQMLTVTADRAALAPATLVIEAVPEEAGLKSEVLAGIEQVVGPHTIIATNTSSISVDDAGRRARATRPLRRDALLQPGAGVAAGRGRARRRHRTRDGGNGPAVGRPHRQADHRGRGLARLREQPARPRDRVGGDPDGRGGCREPGRHRRCDGPRLPLSMGPLRLTDLVGLDVRLGVAEYLAGTLGDRFAPPQLLRDKVARGELGKKSGRGFFDWPDGGS